MRDKGRILRIFALYHACLLGFGEIVGGKRVQKSPETTQKPPHFHTSFSLMNDLANDVSTKRSRKCYQFLPKMLSVFAKNCIRKNVKIYGSPKAATISPTW
jgi:hypothetical protein